MYKIKKKGPSQATKQAALYNIIEDYTA